MVAIAKVTDAAKQYPESVRLQGSTLYHLHYAAQEKARREGGVANKSRIVEMAIREYLNTHFPLGQEELALVQQQTQ